MRNLARILLLFIGLLHVVACKDKPVVSPQEVLYSGYNVNVLTPAGTFENLDNQETLAPPFNIANLEGGKDLDVLILSESLKNGKSLKVIPIGLLRLKGVGDNKEYVIAVPSEEKLNNLGITSFGDLAVNHAVSKQIIESWCQNHSPLTNRTSTVWLSEQSAIEIISKKSAIE